MSNPPEIVGKECRFAVHIPTRSSDIPDFHLVKEVVHYSDGTTKPNIHYRRDFKRPFYVTKKQFRNHKQKKEFEYLERLNKYECTESDLRIRVARALDKGWSSERLRDLAASPYLYAADITSTTILKHEYAEKWPDLVSNYRAAFLDIETDVVKGTNEPILITIIFEKEIKTYVVKSYFDGFAEPLPRAYSNVKKHIANYVEDLKKDREKLVAAGKRTGEIDARIASVSAFEVEIIICDDVVSAIKTMALQLHAWLPDFVAIWNIDFDIPKLLETLKKYKLDPKDVFCDPKLPPELRYCKYKKGSTKKKTASGQVKPKNPSEQWHVLQVPAGFFFIDAMSTYRYVRQGSQELPYYKLDYVLDYELGTRKLHVKETEGVVEDATLDWHILMQQRYVFDYLSYNIFDCIGMFELENKNLDLAQAMPIQCGFTDFEKYISQTKKFQNGFYFHLLEENKIAATVAPVEEKEFGLDSTEPPVEDSDDDEDDDDGVKHYAEEQEVETKNEVMALTGWIVTLAAHLTVLGRNLIEGCSTLLTMIRAFVYDSDAVSAYPSATAVANVSRETTYRELIEIIGVEETDFRRQNINLLQGHVNALEYCNVMHDLPSPEELLKDFE